ncbi:hypothetical protein MLD38_016134 [Melastoma candidum]|uniref:Uncharacterized protein n=1 Tax=Melastoma candidum TaxID=119954 RepID=A0ACB9RI74_9MYRT|nr:hypothetical protein MLD38_016134 [Melastoma candidum]
MGGERGGESWFSSLWRIPRNKGSEAAKAEVGILAFEVVNLMAKVVKIWNCLSEGEIQRIKEEFEFNVGIHHLVSENDAYLMDLALSEIVDELVYIARSVVRLGARCSDPSFQRIELFVRDPTQYELEWSNWHYKSKEMDKQVKKMERFISMALQYSQEQEVLLELEQTLRRMRLNLETDKVKLLEFQQKVMWQRQEVKNLKDLSPWTRTYDYVTRLLASSFFTIIERIKDVFLPIADIGGDSDVAHSTSIHRCQSFSGMENFPTFATENNLSGFYSAPLGTSMLKSSFNYGKKKQQSFHNRTFSQIKSKRLTAGGPFRGCMNGKNDLPVEQQKNQTVFGGSMRISTTCRSDMAKDGKSFSFSSQSNRIYSKLASCYSKCGCSCAQPSTLGNAGLALQYARVIILIEKLSASPHLISQDARDDLYSMLSSPLRSALRAKLRAFRKNRALPIYNETLAAQWSQSIIQMLEWLSPLAQNTMRWQSDRNIEKHLEVSCQNVLLVQTLFFANQAKTETAMVELLVGLNYLYRISVEMPGRSLPALPRQDPSVYGQIRVNSMDGI